MSTDPLEDALRAAMRERGNDGDTGSGSLFEAVAGRRRRRVRGQQLLAGVAVAVVAIATPIAVGRGARTRQAGPVPATHTVSASPTGSVGGPTAGGSGGGPQEPAPTSGAPSSGRSTAPTRCAAHGPVQDSNPHNTRPGIGQEFVPGHPIRALTCRYAGDVSGRRLLTATVVGTGIGGFVAALNAVPTPPQDATYSCPTGDGSVAVVYFSYASGDPLEIRLDLTGCRFGSNGARHPMPENQWPI